MPFVLLKSQSVRAVAGSSIGAPRTRGRLGGAQRGEAIVLRLFVFIGVFQPNHGLFRSGHVCHNAP